MIVIEPIAIGDVSFARASPKWVHDRAGTLVEVPANTLAVTYDPNDLSSAPYALIEPEATNRLRNNTMQGAAAGSPGTRPTYWGMWLEATGLTWAVSDVGTENGIPYVDMRLQGAVTAGSVFDLQFEAAGQVLTGLDETWALSVFLRLADGSFSGVSGISIGLSERDATTSVRVETAPVAVTDAPLSGQRKSALLTIGNAATLSILPFVRVHFFRDTPVDFTLRVGLPQLERDRVTSPTKAVWAAFTRAADVIGAGAGLVYSNVPIAEQTYDAKVSYAKDALVYDPATYRMFQSLIANNLGKALSDTGAWAPRGAVNRAAMFDEYNNTQTTMRDEIVIVLTPEMVAQGLYLGNLEVDEVKVSMIDSVDGLIYSEITSLIESNSKSSYFNWLFKRIKRRTYFLALDLPVYANALVTVCLQKIGGIAKCGMCAIGPVDEFGPTLLGLSTEGKDYSSTTFNFDGTSNTTLRPYAKRMSCDVVVANDEITYVQDRLSELRQRPLVWVGGPYGVTAVFGRYGSFKNVIEYQTQSKMNLTIEGAV